MRVVEKRGEEKKDEVGEATYQLVALPDASLVGVEVLPLLATCRAAGLGSLTVKMTVAIAS